MTRTDDLANRSLTIERRFTAPLQLVWDAWTQSNHIAAWWGPKGMEVHIEAQNFTVGGEWRYRMDMPDGSAFISEGKYLVIEEGKKIVSTANFRPMTEGVELHIEFTEDAGHTLLKFTVVHPTVDYCIQQEKMGFYNGWGSSLDRLNAYLSEQ